VYVLVRRTAGPDFDSDATGMSRIATLWAGVALGNVGAGLAGSLRGLAGALTSAAVAAACRPAAG